MDEGASLPHDLRIGADVALPDCWNGTDLLFVYGTLKTVHSILPGLLQGLPFSYEGSGVIRGVWLQGTFYPAVLQDDNGPPDEGIRKLYTYEEFYPDDHSRSLYIR